MSATGDHHGPQDEGLKADKAAVQLAGDQGSNPAQRVALDELKIRNKKLNLVKRIDPAKEPRYEDENNQNEVDGTLKSTTRLRSPRQEEAEGQPPSTAS